MSRPRPGQVGYRPPAQEPKYVETDITPEQLAKASGQNDDVTMIRETHGSQKLVDMEAKMMKAADPELHVTENSASQNGDYTKPDFDFVNNWGKERNDVKYAVDNGIKVIGGDVEHENSEHSTTVFSLISKSKDGNVAQLETAMGLSIRHQSSNGASEEEVVDRLTEMAEESSTPRELIDKYVAEYGDDIPKFHQENLYEAVEDQERDEKSGIFNSIGKFIDGKSDLRNFHSAKDGRLEESDPNFSKELDEALQEFREKHPEANATLIVGEAHGPGIEANLKEKGYTVGDIEIVTTEDPEKHGKVYVRHGGSDADPDYVVAVHDPDAQVADRDTKFDLQGKPPPPEQQAAVSPTQMSKDNGEGQSQAQPQQSQDIHTR